MWRAALQACAAGQLAHRWRGQRRRVLSAGIRGVISLARYECLTCGYIYDPAVGDPHSGIAQGAPFEELPADWVCPECGVGKDMFEMLASEEKSDSSETLQRDAASSVSQTPRKYECLTCGYVYNPAVGDPDGGIESGTPFGALRDDWVCPECGVGKDMFEAVE